MIFTLILFTEGRKKKNRLHFFLQRPMKSFSFVSLRPAARGTPDISVVYSTWKSSIFPHFSVFLLLFIDLLVCSWSDLLVVSAMIKPFELINVLVSSVCTVPNTRNTRRSTALGETPLIWYCARYQNHPIPRSLDGCGCGVQRGRVHVCVLGVTTAAASFWVSLSPPPTPQQFQVGDWWESKLSRRG